VCEEDQGKPYGGLWSDVIVIIQTAERTLLVATFEGCSPRFRYPPPSPPFSPQRKDEAIGMLMMKDYFMLLI
jgi:hypothetical protein